MTPIASQLAGRDAPSLVDRTIQEYPGLEEPLRAIAFRVSPRAKGDRRGLEFYAPDEERSFAPGHVAIEVFDPEAQPKDVAGDLVSHWLARGRDPVVTHAYNEFEASLTPEQKATLRSHYAWDRKHGEDRDYATWYRMSGLPAYFRGRLFRQWDENDGPYTPEQLARFELLDRYLRTPKRPEGPGKSQLRRNP